MKHSIKLLFFLSVACLMLLFGCDKKTEEIKTTDSLIRAVVKADGSEAFIPLPNGKIIDIVDNDIYSA